LQALVAKQLAQHHGFFSLGAAPAV
jgi:hypothetical protein